MTFKGWSVAWIAARGPGRGRASVWIDGHKVATVDLWAPKSASPVVAWVGSWTTRSERKITIKVEGTPGRHRVDLDSLVVIK